MSDLREMTERLRKAAQAAADHLRDTDPHGEELYNGCANECLVEIELRAALEAVRAALGTSEQASDLEMLCVERNERQAEREAIAAMFDGLADRLQIESPPLADEIRIDARNVRRGDFARPKGGEGR